MINEKVLRLSVADLAKLIKARELSPLELTKAYLERSERLGPVLRTYVTLTEKTALREAKLAEKEILQRRYRGPLHGIPYAAKDIIAARDYPTTWGARPLARQKFKEDAAVIERLRAAGAVLIGKAACVELAGGISYKDPHSSLTGATKNPWNHEFWAGGSSSGSAAIVASAQAAFALGTETMGSLLGPSAYCGLSGLRPTYGRVSRRGVMMLAPSLDKVGPMCRTARDCGILLQMLAGHDPGDPWSLPAGTAEFEISERFASPLRIGWLTNGVQNPPAEAKAAAANIKRALKEAGAAVSNARLIEGPWEMVASLTHRAESAVALDALVRSGGFKKLSDASNRAGFAAAHAFRSADYLRAQNIRRAWRSRLLAVFDEFDVVIVPPQANHGVKLNPDGSESEFPTDLAGPIGNLYGLPAITVPCGFDGKKMPMAAQFLGAPLKDAAVLRVAELFQKVTDWHTRWPGAGENE